MEINKIYNMDCLEGMKHIPDGSIDAIICDLPYGTTACAWDSVIPFDKLWEQYKRIVKPNGPIVLFGSEPFSTLLRMSNLKCYKYDWIWDKQFGGNFVNAKLQPLKIHELISVFCYGTANYYPQMMKRDEPIKKGGNFSGDWGIYGQFKADDGYKGKIYDEKYPETILEFSSRADYDDHFHPTQKPVDLLRYLIRTYSNEGDTILDNCMGSGTTAVACIKEKRNFIGFETDPTFYAKACRRIEEARKNLTLF